MGFSNFIKKMMLAGQIDFEEGHFEMLGIRGVILPAFTMTKLVEQMYQKIGDDVFDLLYEVGTEHGHFGVEKMGKQHRVAKKRFFSELTGSANVMGLGNINIEHFSPDRKALEMTIQDSPLTKAFTQSPILQDIDRPIHDFLRGVIEAMAADVMDHDMAAVEEQCEFLGADRCRITVTATGGRHGPSEQHSGG